MGGGTGKGQQRRQEQAPAAWFTGDGGFFFQSSRSKMAVGVALRENWTLRKRVALSVLMDDGREVCEVCMASTNFRS